MPDLPTLALFVTTAVVLLVVPGPAVLYVVARSVEQGRQAGLVSTLGIGVGTLFHLAAAVLGISAILASSAVAFQVVKLAGAAYLVFLGLRQLIRREESAPAAPRSFGSSRLSRVFLQGVVVNLLNPKTALFFLAFLPQFVDPVRGSVSVQILSLGLLFITLAVLSDGAYALVAGALADLLRGNRRLLAAQRYASGGTLVALGVGAALVRRE